MFTTLNHEQPSSWINKQQQHRSASPVFGAQSSSMDQQQQYYALYAQQDFASHHVPSMSFAHSQHGYVHGFTSNSAPAYASPSFHSLSLREQLPSIMTQQLSSSLDGALDESNIGSSLSQTKLKPKDHSTLSSRQLRTGSSSDRTLASSCALSVDEIRHSKAAASFLLPRPGVKRREYKKMHACQVCQKTFPRPSGLKTHMNTHDQIRPFRCTVDGCGKSFTVKSNCKRHLRTHGRNLEESSRRFEEYSNPSSSPDLPNSTLHHERSDSQSSSSSPLSSVPSISPTSTMSGEVPFPIPHPSQLPAKLPTGGGGWDLEESWGYYSDELPLVDPAAVWANPQPHPTGYYSEPLFTGGQPTPSYPAHLSCHW